MQERSDFNFIFYTTSGCHLCDEAMAMLAMHFPDHVLRIGLCDIASDDILIDRYGTKIPVLEKMENEEVLAWPFNIEQLAGFFNLQGFNSR